MNVADIWDLPYHPWNSLQCCRGGSLFPSFHVFLLFDLPPCLNRAPSLAASQERMYARQIEILYERFDASFIFKG